MNSCYSLNEQKVDGSLGNSLKTEWLPNKMLSKWIQYLITLSLKPKKLKKLRLVLIVSESKVIGYVANQLNSWNVSLGQSFDSKHKKDYESYSEIL